MPPRVPLFLAGPTAAGKSAVAVCLAEKLGGEIISVDSMQVYRGLDVGTAKPSAAEQRGIPHHLIDVASLNETFDAARFVRLARKAAQSIQGRGKTPVFCGGTGLYFKAFLAGLGEAPPADAALRAELAAAPLSNLLAELQKKDPVTHEKIDRQNPRRVIRALEVIRLTGQPFSRQRAAWAENETPPRNFFCLSRPAADLHSRINRRVDLMFQHGLVEEVRRLLEAGLAENQNARQAIGYRQVAEHLRGERPLAETVDLVKIRTRQFAKRQLTWFRRQLTAQWIDCGPEKTAENVARRILEKVDL